MMDYALLSAGFAVMALGDLNLTRSGHRSWIHLDQDQRAILGKDGAQSQAQGLVLGVQLWLPIIGVLISYLLFKSTVETAIELNISDLMVALLYSGSFVILFWGPAALLERAGTEYVKRWAAAMVESGPSPSEGGRRWAERFWRSAIAVGFLMTAVSLSSIVGLPMFFGIPVGVIMLKKRFDERTRHLERCRVASKVALRIREGNDPARPQ